MTDDGEVQVDDNMGVQVDSSRQEQRQSELDRVIEFLVQLTQTDRETIMTSAILALMEKHRIDFENKLIFGVYIADVEDVLVKEEDGERTYITEIFGKTFVLKDVEIEFRRLQDAIRLARVFMDTSGRIAIVYKDSNSYRVLAEAYDLLKDTALTARIEKIYRTIPSH